MSGSFFLFPNAMLFDAYLIILYLHPIFCCFYNVFYFDFLYTSYYLLNFPFFIIKYDVN